MVEKVRDDPGPVRDEVRDRFRVKGQVRAWWSGMGRIEVNKLPCVFRVKYDTCQLASTTVYVVGPYMGVEVTMQNNPDRPDLKG